MASDTSQNFDIVNAQNSKEPVIILEIEGVPWYISTAKIYTNVRYDDPDVFYDGTYVYDGLRPLESSKQKNYIDRKSSKATISQKLEQWDGKASIETANLKIIDKDGEITQLITPGKVIDEILNKKVTIWWGYKNISFKEDYLRIFTGYINQVDSMPGSYNFSFTDPSNKRKTSIFNGATTKLTSAVGTGDTTFNMLSNTQLYRTILNAKGVNDTTVTIGFIVGNEIITFVNSGCVSQTQITGCVRGQFGTIAESHGVGDEVTPFLYIEDNPVTIALKTSLSGWNGACFDNIGLRGINNTDNGYTVLDSITFNQGVDLQRDYGLTIGDFITLSGSPNPANNASFTIKDFVNDNRTALVLETGILIQENPTVTTKAAFRSKYDTYPTSAGFSLTTDDVNVSRHEYLRDTFVPIVFKMKIKGEEKSGKEWIEKHLFKPIGGYALTQGSRISFGVTHPPLVDDLSKKIDHKNVVNAKSISVKRGMNNRFFYNEVLFKYDYDPLNDSFNRQARYIDADSQNRMSQVSVLEIECRGLDDSSNSLSILSQRAERILQRYRFSPETINVECFFSTGNTIDSGDICVLSDKENTPILQIPNTENGERGIYNRIMEVQDRTKDMSSGTTKVSLLSNNGFSFSDRYAVIGGSSYVDGSGVNTSTKFKYRDFDFTIFPGAEYKKWAAYVGSRIVIHDILYTQSHVSTFTLDVTDPYYMILATPCPFSLTDGMIIELAPYDDSVATSDSIVKSTFAFRSATSTILTGSSTNVFTLSVPEAAQYQESAIIYVMSPDGTRYSPDVRILSLISGIVTIGPLFSWSTTQDLGFVPQPGDIVFLGGYKDGGASYRFI